MILKPVGCKYAPSLDYAFVECRADFANYQDAVRDALQPIVCALKPHGALAKGDPFTIVVNAPEGGSDVEFIVCVPISKWAGVPAGYATSALEDGNVLYLHWIGPSSFEDLHEAFDRLDAALSDRDVVSGDFRVIHAYEDGAILEVQLPFV